jgi:hypothetical protein
MRKKKVQLTIYREERIACDVEYPIYRKERDSSAIILGRTDEDLRTIEITTTETPHGPAFSIQHIEKWDFKTANGIAELHLGKGPYACTEEEFLRALLVALRSVSIAVSRWDMPESLPFAVKPLKVEGACLIAGPESAGKRFVTVKARFSAIAGDCGGSGWVPTRWLSTIDPRVVAEWIMKDQAPFEWEEGSKVVLQESSDL